MKRLSGCGLGVLFLLWTGLAQAAVMESMSMAELSASAEVVVHGVAVSSVCRFEDAPNAGRIVTDVTIRVIDSVRGIGAEQTSIVVTTLGGEMGEHGQWIPGAPRLAVGDEVVLFLTRPVKRTVGIRYVPVGLSQSVFFVDRSLDATRPVVRQRLSGLSIRTSTGTVDDAPAGIVMGLNEMVNFVRQGL